MLFSLISHANNKHLLMTNFNYFFLTSIDKIKMKLLIYKPATFNFKIKNENAHF